MPYADWLPAQMPTSLQGPWGERLARALGEEFDEQAGNLRAAVLSAFPEHAPADALAYIGRELSLPQGAGETDDAYAARLTQAFSAWKRAGSHPALLEQLKLAGLDYANMYVIQANGRRSSIDASNAVTFADGPPVQFVAEQVSPNWDQSKLGPEIWQRFGLLFTVDQPALTHSGGVFSALAAAMNAICWKWRPARMIYMGASIIVSGGVWGWPTTRTWGDGSMWGGVTRHIPPT